MLKKAVRALRRATGPRLATDFWDRFRHLSGFEMEGSEREWQQLCLYTEMMHRLADVPGDIAEFGVGSGVSLLAFVRVNDVLQKGLDDRARRRIYGFDSFEGLPKLSSFDLPSSGAEGGVQMKEGGYSGAAAYASLVQYLAAHRNVTLLKGWFSQTLPPFLEKNQHVGFALVHVDCDLYESTRDCLSLVLSRVVPGGIVLFDEIFHPQFPGETKGFFEVFGASSWRHEFAMRRSRSMPWKSYLVREGTPSPAA
jgi:predicted O-methyltransferase YrrM